MTETHTVKGNLAGGGAILMWSFSALLISYTAGMSSFLLGACVFLLGFFFYLMRWGVQRKSLRALLRQRLRTYAVTFTGITGYTCLYYTALKTAPILEANLINYLWPICLVLFSAALLRAPLRLPELGGLGLGFGGAVLVLLKGGETSFGAESFLIYLPAVGGALVWGLYSVLIKNEHFDQDFMGIVYLFCGVVMGSIHVFFEAPCDFSSVVWWPVVTLGATVIAFSFWNYGMAHGDMILLATGSYLIPLFSTLLLVIFGRGAMAGQTMLGGSLIVAGCLLANWKKLRPQSA